MTNQFKDFDIDPRLIENLADLKFHTMTPIQEKSLPIVLAGDDIIAQAKTGSGKTAAFGLGVLNGLDFRQNRPQSLILCPTRELAEQVAKELRTLARKIPNVKVLTITGGKSEYQQERSLSHGAHIIVGTPGRVLKLLKKKIINLRFVTYYVLDEADRMLDMGFSEEINRITSFVPRKRQTLLFSATFPHDIEELSSKLQRDAKKVTVDVSHQANVIQEEFYEVESHKEKTEALIKVLKKYQSERFIVFCKTKRITDVVAKDLKKAGVKVAAIHGDLDQNERTKVLTTFSNKSLLGVVATDVAARGIDVKGLDLVVNYDLSNDPEVHVHRIGRTGRAGSEGRAISFLVNQELDNFEKILEYQSSQHELKFLNEIEASEEYSVVPQMKTLMINGGKRDKLRPGDIVGAIVGESGIDFNNIGDINITNTASFVAISSSHISEVEESLRNGRIKKKKFKVRTI